MNFLSTILEISFLTAVIYTSISIVLQVSRLTKRTFDKILRDIFLTLIGLNTLNLSLQLVNQIDLDANSATLFAILRLIQSVSAFVTLIFALSFIETVFAGKTKQGIYFLLNSLFILIFINSLFAVIISKNNYWGIIENIANINSIIIVLGVGIWVFAIVQISLGEILFEISDLRESLLRNIAIMSFFLFILLVALIAEVNIGFSFVYLIESLILFPFLLYLKNLETLQLSNPGTLFRVLLLNNFGTTVSSINVYEFPNLPNEQLISGFLQVFSFHIEYFFRFENNIEIIEYEKFKIHVNSTETFKVLLITDIDCPLFTPSLSYFSRQVLSLIQGNPTTFSELQHEPIRDLALRTFYYIE